jgi:hypothetical protein
MVWQGKHRRGFCPGLPPQKRDTTYAAGPWPPIPQPLSLKRFAQRAVQGVLPGHSVRLNPQLRLKQHLFRLATVTGTGEKIFRVRHSPSQTSTQRASDLETSKNSNSQ